METEISKLVNIISPIGIDKVSQFQYKYPIIIEKVLNLTKFLDKHYEMQQITIAQRYHHIFNKNFDITRCDQCQSPIKWDRVKKYKKFCSQKCSHAKNKILYSDPVFLENHIKKSKITSLHKFGVENYNLTSEFKKKQSIVSNQRVTNPKTPKEKKVRNKTRPIKEKDIDRYEKLGYELIRYNGNNIITLKHNSCQNIFDIGKDIKNSRYQKSIIICVICNPIISGNEISRMKGIQSIKEKYDVTSVFGLDHIKEKIKKTLMNKYGFEKHSQVPELVYRSNMARFRHKDYIFPSGRIEKIQGYENKAIDEIIHLYDENDIVVGMKDIIDCVGTINYKYMCKLRRYYPDIFIKSLNKIIEVKSEYGYFYFMEINHLKRKACLNLGFDFEFKIYH